MRRQKATKLSLCRINTYNHSWMVYLKGKSDYLNTVVNSTLHLFKWKLLPSLSGNRHRRDRGRRLQNVLFICLTLTASCARFALCPSFIFELQNFSRNVLTVVVSRHWGWFTTGVNSEQTAKDVHERIIFYVPAVHLSKSMNAPLEDTGMRTIRRCGPHLLRLLGLLFGCIVSRQERWPPFSQTPTC